MKIKTFAVFLFLVIAIYLSVKGQTPLNLNQTWSLEQCIDYALKNNITIKQTELNKALADLNLTQSKANLLPTLNANASHNYNYGRTIDRFTNQFATQQVLSQNLSLSSDITIFNGFQNINTIKENKYSFLATSFDVEKIRNDISLNIASDYLQILFAAENAINTQNQLSITNAQIERTQKLVDAGASAMGSLLDIQAQYASEELNVINAQNQLDLANLSLAQLLNLPSSEGFTIIKPELLLINETLLSSTPSQIYATAVSNLPEIKSADYKLKSAQKAMDVAWGGISPRLSFSASYGTGYSSLKTQQSGDSYIDGTYPIGVTQNSHEVVESPITKYPTEITSFSQQYNDNANKSFGFYLTVPIFNRLQTKTSIDRARIQKMNAELTVEATKLQVQKNIQQAFSDANAALKKYNATQKALEAMQESFKYTEQKYNVGMVNTNDFNTAKNKLIKTQSDLLQAKYEFVFKTKVLDFYQGKALKL